MTRLRSVLLAAGIAVLATGSLAAQTDVISMTEDQNVLEFVGQFNNTPTTSQQFGYLSRIEGLDETFTANPQNEATALFTFVTNATTDRVIANGPFRIVNRTGTTTVYLNTPPSDFTNPASFSTRFGLTASVIVWGASERRFARATPAKATLQVLPHRAGLGEMQLARPILTTNYSVLKNNPAAP